MPCSNAWGGGNKMDCKTARMLADLRGPHGTELSPDDELAFQAHLSTCSDCAPVIRGEIAFDRNLARAMVAVPIPVGLKARLLDNLTHERVGWYRRRFWQLSAAAAAVLVGSVVPDAGGVA